MNYRDELYRIISERAFVQNSQEVIDHYTDLDNWLFDFRRVLMNGQASHIVGEVFYERFAQDYPFQICSVEVAGVPLGTGLMHTMYHKGHHDINSFFIRKSRKKNGLFRMIEGEIHETKKIILVDDLINTGGSLWRQIEVLHEMGYQVDTVWALMRFRDMNYYQKFHQHGIKVESVFCLDDFTDQLGERVANFHKPDPVDPIPMPFESSWVFKAANANLGLVLPKSQPILDESHIYVGSDSGSLWAINQTDGSVTWSHKAVFTPADKGTLSGPALFENLVITADYSGDVFAVDKTTGKRVWVNHEADYVGSSPCINHRDGIVYAGTEFGLIGKRGGIIALDARTGKKIWSDYSHSALTHASPLWIESTNEIVIGSNEGVVYMYDAKTGERKWTQTTFGGAWYDTVRDGGFGDGSIKLRPAYDAKRDYVIVNSIDGYLYVLNRSNGNIVHHHQSRFACWSTPLVWQNYVYWTSEDKHIRCMNLDTLTVVWEKNLDWTRIFASPTIINDKLYIGTNAGRLYELDPETGEETGYFQSRERITNYIIYNNTTDTYFLPTYANEIICLKKKGGH